ncbi:HEAT repeat domain-containing protein [Kitasatospora sp. NPDC088134]|uniref:HEAT repeat domain-containing protein n=1 Tax=Kitasatospora sp. NPDC088134 TaxID=3364071 RepID=UPI0038137EEA
MTETSAAALDEQLRTLTGLLTAGSAEDREAACARLRRIADPADDEVRALVAPPLLALAEVERDARVLPGLVRALAATYDPRALPVLTGLAGHPEAEVRRAVAESLTALETERADGPDVAALLALAEDADPEVRAWAVFALGSQLTAYGPAIRAALHERLDDVDEDVVDEAVRGLARRQEGAVTELLAELLEDESDDPHPITLHAAAALGRAELLPALRELDADQPLVAAALAACDPERREQLAASAWQLVEALERLRPDLAAALCSERFSPDVDLLLPGAPDPARYSVPHLLRRAGEDPSRAASLVDEDLPVAATAP